MQLTNDEEISIQDEAFNKVEKELESIFEQIKLKAEFLIKLQIPLQYLNKNYLFIKSNFRKSWKQRRRVKTKNKRRIKMKLMLTANKQEIMFYHYCKLQFNMEKYRNKWKRFMLMHLKESLD